MTRLVRAVLAVQGGFYVLTGLWPLVSLRSFERVLGPKADDWLVHTVGLLALAIGAALLVGRRATRPGPETLVLAGTSAAAFAAIDLVYALGGQISRVYLADAGLELGFLLVVLAAASRQVRGT